MKLTGLHVIGDSKLILTHLARRRPPKAAHLRDIYAQCRTIADQLQITSWTHHLRHFNKTADKLANLAMDTKCSIQVLDTDIEHLTPTWSSVTALLTSDVSQWIETHLDPDEDGRRSNSLGNSEEDACASTFNGS
ncbi:hypothetical protein PHYSODRAFT_531978 [Phytophthora sojae]|uniref:RNase H type-1 domain-containing protein n=1 Tax=Phytophthora sojae (strain P6497) TaxID=1094619 RepID=G5AE55_PHYSP|nr:hypothetical protein PHYSODRAFT_531978 [Phytophthora sojae]EGZ06457.1 hypothetical protein PHYSODRAFT_531978 [Phytophthora sojae]|eukprot:XP_009538354.1 hypothetical protein PHYSODRAFT_531978 [Phytophthora sojae]